MFVSSCTSINPYCLTYMCKACSTSESRMNTLFSIEWLLGNWTWLLQRFFNKGIYAKQKQNKMYTLNKLKLLYLHLSWASTVTTPSNDCSHSYQELEWTLNQVYQLDKFNLGHLKYFSILLPWILNNKWIIQVATEISKFQNS